MSNGIPCNASMNQRYDEYLYQRLNEILVSKFRCSVPFLPNTQITNHNKICKNAKKRQKAYALYDLLKRNKENIVCPNPCSSIEVYFGIMFQDVVHNENRAYLQFYLPTTTRINFTVLDYDGVAMLADIGGYSGLLLGLSAAHLSKLLFKAIVKMLNFPRKQKKKEDTKDIIFKLP